MEQEEVAMLKAEVAKLRAMNSNMSNNPNNNNSNSNKNSNGFNNSNTYNSSSELEQKLIADIDNLKKEIGNIQIAHTDTFSF